MIGQYYSVSLNDDTRDKMLAGSFVMEANDSKIAVGFVSRVDFQSDIVEICLFEPRELPETVTIIHESIAKSKMVHYLECAISEN